MKQINICKLNDIWGYKEECSLEAKGKFSARDHGRIQQMETRGSHGIKNTLGAWVYESSWI